MGTGRQIVADFFVFLCPFFGTGIRCGGCYELEERCLVCVCVLVCGYVFVFVSLVSVCACVRVCVCVCVIAGCAN